MLERTNKKNDLARKEAFYNYKAKEYIILNNEIEDMIYHTKIVASSVNYSFLISDMPFMSFYNANVALDNAKRLMQDGGAQMVKLEGIGLK